MAILQAKKLKASLEKAKRVGLVEEPVTIAGCPIVLRSLPPEDYEAIADETKDLEEVAYLHAFQIGHLCRAIVEINGVDFRDADFIEEEEDGKPIKLEKQAWIRDNILKTWGREAIITGWRKFAEVLIKADEKAKEGIHFSIAEESPEEKFRRLLGEVKESTEDLPDELVAKILDDEGYLLKSSRQELDAAAEKLSEVQPSLPTEEPSSVPEELGSVEPPKDTSVEDLMKNRVPMNQGSVEVPTPQRQTVVTATQKPAPVPPQIREAAVPVQSLSRAAQIAALENVPLDAAPTPTVGAPKSEVVEIRRSEATDPNEVRTILDRPPAIGMNPRYSPPRRP